MQEKLELVSAIQLGLRKGFNQNLQFRNKWTSFEDKMTEYLLTVFVALEINEFFGNTLLYDVQLEYRLFEFYNNAFPQYRWKWENEEDLWSEKSFLIRDFNLDTSKKRIDIVVMYTENGIYGHYRSLHGIEIKAINQHLSKIELDVLRLSTSMISTATIDSNSIDSCFSAFIKLYKNKKSATTEADLSVMRNESEQEIKDLLDNKFRSMTEYDSLEYIIHSEKINSNSLESYYNSVKHIPDFDLSWDPETETGEVMGFVIEITRKQV